MEIACESQCELGEGPVYDPLAETLYWVDIIGKKLHSMHLADGRWVTREYGEEVCAVAPFGGGRLLAAFRKRIVLLDAGGSIEKQICEVEPDLPSNRCNDGKMDPCGRFWIGTLGKAGSASLYCLEDGQLKPRMSGLTISNGLAWSGDTATMYHIDSPTRQVVAWALDPATGALGGKRILFELPEGNGVPDGMTMAPDGTLWVACWNGSRVINLDPRTGRLLRDLKTGCPRTTSCCFDGEGNLFITTARTGLDEAAQMEFPHSGDLLRYPAARL